MAYLKNWQVSLVFSLFFTPTVSAIDTEIGELNYISALNQANQGRIFSWTGKTVISEFDKDKDQKLEGSICK